MKARIWKSRTTPRHWWAEADLEPGKPLTRYRQWFSTWEQAMRWVARPWIVGVQ